MNTVTTIPSAPRPRRSWFWSVLAAGFLIWLVAVTMLAFECLTPSRGAGLLRREMLAAVSSGERRQVQLRVGPGTLAAARLAFRFIPETPAEAGLALDAVREASVAVYQLSHDADAATRRRMFEAADHALGGRGWNRLIGINNAHETVVIYTPAEDGDERIQHVCLAVCEAGQLVIVEGVIAAEPLAELVANKLPRLAVN